MKFELLTDVQSMGKGALELRRIRDRTQGFRVVQTLVDLLRIQQEIQASTIAVADCTTAGSGPGPRTMTPVVKDLLIASEDQVAIDAVAAIFTGPAVHDHRRRAVLARDAGEPFFAGYRAGGSTVAALTAQLGHVVPHEPRDDGPAKDLALHQPVSHG